MILIEKQIKEYLKTRNFVSSPDFMQELELRTKKLIDDACDRVDHNHKRTLTYKDVPLYFISQRIEYPHRIFYLSKLKEHTKIYNVNKKFNEALTFVILDVIENAISRAKFLDRNTLIKEDL